MESVELNIVENVFLLVLKNFKPSFVATTNSSFEMGLTNVTASCIPCLIGFSGCTKNCLNFLVFISYANNPVPSVPNQT